MAFWLKWEKGLVRKHEILQIAARLHVPPAQAAGALMMVMEWLDDAVSDYDESGNANVTLGALPLSFIDTLVGIDGYSDALSEVGWLRHEGDALTFVNAGRHNGITAKNRALTRERVSRHRKEKVKRSCNAPQVTKSLLFSISSEGIQKGGSERPVTVIPLLLSTDPFAEAWRDWLQHRREKKCPITPGSQTEKQQLKTLEQWGVERAIAAIRYTIFKGWQGLREPDPSDKEYASQAARKNAAPRPDIYVEPPNWRETFKRKFPDVEPPAAWSELSATMRNALIQ